MGLGLGDGLDWGNGLSTFVMFVAFAMVIIAVAIWGAMEIGNGGGTSSDLWKIVDYNGVNFITPKDANTAMYIDQFAFFEYGLTSFNDPINIKNGHSLNMDSVSGGSAMIFPANIANDIYLTSPDHNGVLATVSDIPSSLSFVPYTGATGNVNLGYYDLNSDLIIANRALGIGTAADPINYQLHIKNPLTTNILQEVDSNAGYALMMFKAAGELLGFFGKGNTANNDLTFATYNDTLGAGGNGLRFVTDSKMRMYIDANGNSTVYGDLKVDCIKFSGNESDIMCGTPYIEDDPYQLALFDENVYLFVNAATGNDTEGCGIGFLNECETISAALETAEDWPFSNIFIDIEAGDYNEDVVLSNKYSTNMFYFTGRTDVNGFPTVNINGTNKCIDAYNSNLYMNGFMLNDCNYGIYSYNSYIDMNIVDINNTVNPIYATNGSAVIFRNEDPNSSNYILKDRDTNEPAISLISNSSFINKGNIYIWGYKKGAYLYAASLYKQEADFNTVMRLAVLSEYAFYLTHNSMLDMLGNLYIDGEQYSEVIDNTGLIITSGSTFMTQFESMISMSNFNLAIDIEDSSNIIDNNAVFDYTDSNVFVTATRQTNIISQDALDTGVQGITYYEVVDQPINPSIYDDLYLRLDAANEIKSVDNNLNIKLFDGNINSEYGTQFIFNKNDGLSIGTYFDSGSYTYIEGFSVSNEGAIDTKSINLSYGQNHDLKAGWFWGGYTPSGWNLINLGAAPSGNQIVMEDEGNSWNDGLDDGTKGSIDYVEGSFRTGTNKTFAVLDMNQIGNLNFDYQFSIPYIETYGQNTDGDLKLSSKLKYSAGNGLDVNNTIKAQDYKSSDGSLGLTQVLTVRDSAGTGTCTMTFKNGLLTATTC